MKTFFALAVFVCLISSCNKCYRCTRTGEIPQDFCKGNPQYEQAKKNMITDFNGSEMQCSAL